MKPKTKSIVFFVVLIVVVVVVALVVGDRTDGSRTKATYSEFLQQVQAGEVSKATIAVAELIRLVVGTHVPDDRDNFQSALQRMREAFEALRDGRQTPGQAEDDFLSGYDVVADMSTMWFVSRRP